MRLRPIKFLAFVHRWLGFPLAVLFLVVLVSGQYIAIGNLASRLDKHGQHYAPVPLDQAGRDLAKLLVRYPTASNLAVPRPDAPFYRVSDRAEAVILNAESLEVVHQVQPGNDRLRRWFLGLHRNYLKGSDGRHVVAWVAILSMVISLVGVITWYPYRRTTRLKETIPTSLKRGRLFRSHFTGGLVGLLAFILLGLTGASITYRSVARDILSVDQTAPPPRFDAPHYIARDWPTRLALAQEYFPDGTITKISRPRNQPRGQALIEIRFSTPSDWSLMGDSAVTVHENDSSFIGIRKFGDLPFGDKLYRMIRPLHDGTSMPVAYLWFLVIANGLLIVMVATALLSFLQKTYRPIDMRFLKHLGVRLYRAR